MSDLEALFDKVISENLEAINKITPLNPTVAKDDEWNDPVYDLLYADTNGSKGKNG